MRISDWSSDVCSSDLFHSEQAGQAEDNSSLCDHEHRSEPEYEQRHRKHGMNDQHHANGKEKQPQQDGTKRLNICLDFMPIGGVRQHYACHESAKRRRKMEVMHQSRTGEHSEKPDDHEQLTLAKPACQSEKRIKEEAARKYQASYGSDSI